MTFYIHPGRVPPGLHGQIPNRPPPQIQKWQQQGLCLSEAPAGTAVTAILASIVQHTPAGNLSPLLTSSVMSLGKSLVLSEPWCARLENGVCQPNPGVSEVIHLEALGPFCPGCRNPCPPASTKMASSCGGHISPGVGGGEAEGERAPTWLNNYPHLRE